MNLLKILLIFLCIDTFSQNIYLVYFKDKTNTNHNFSHPEEYLSQKSLYRRTKQNISIKYADLPVNQQYIDSLEIIGANVWYRSKWMNAAYVKCDTFIANRSISGLGFVKKVQKLYTFSPSGARTEKTKKTKNVEKITFSASDYGDSYHQANSICVDVMHSKGYLGNGMTIAVTDGGFTNVNNMIFFDSLYQFNQIKGTYDFVDNDSTVYHGSTHGTYVLSLIAGNKKGLLIGTAPKADFYLFRTENDGTENLVEEANWLIAAEKADSLGVDIINVSLGYNTFDDSSQNHKTKEMDGNTTLITQAADMAAATGMIIVVSAGNSGNSSWKSITAPADADSVLAIGAVDNQGVEASFSGYGPSADGRVKPDLAAQGKNCTFGETNNTIRTGSGTSFSAPIVTGLVAGLWQANNTLTNMQIITALKKSGSIFDNPNNRIGYGIPCFTRAQNIIYGLSEIVNPLTEKIYLYPNPLYDSNLNINIIKSLVGQPIELELYNTHGKLFFTIIINNSSLSNTIDLGNIQLERGYYIARLKIGNYIQFLKLTKG